MPDLDAWFPYPSYRPCQKEMLERAAEVTRTGGTLLIDAPTGSGKSSVIAALLSEAAGRPVFIAVRTVSQLNTFIRELRLIREHRSDLKFAYLVGKSSICPLRGEGNVYRKCEGVKAFSVALMTDRAERGSLIPAKDLLIRQQIRKMSPDHPLICPYYIHSKSFVPQEDAGVRMVASVQLRTLSERISAKVVDPERLREACGDLCPYETMVLAARGADVVVLNFHHLFDDAIREQLYQSMGVEASGAILLIDEAHNCGETVQGIRSVELGEESLDAAAHELSHARHAEAEAALKVIPGIRHFMEMLHASKEPEDWFDPEIFFKTVLHGSLQQGFEEIVQNFLQISDRVREKNMRAGDFRETALEHVTRFLYACSSSRGDPTYLTVHRNSEEGVTLEVRNIDPSEALLGITKSHAACVMISGTFSPVASYRKLYFRNEPVHTLTLPNTFPKENRLILCARDVTTAYSMRSDPGNRNRIQTCINAFANLPGNRAIYFPSYQILESFAAQADAGNHEIFIEPRESGEAGIALKRFLELPGTGRSGILFAVCGGKWSEGLDYRGDLLSGAMVIGLPLAPYTRVRRMVIQYFTSRFGEEGEFLSYMLPAVNRALQALGRVLRTPEDRGILILGEKRFLEPKIRLALPPWMQQEMQVMQSDTIEEVLAAWQ
ncbi:MAG: ATP-dependent DNA helicase [Methanomicrobiales archaeon]|nr:ATP-dependent DNA helicase [Methanomicrobiales archaeon]